MWARIMLHAPDDAYSSLSCKLEFLCSNNEAKYEAVIIELISGLQWESESSMSKEIPGSSSNR